MRAASLAIVKLRADQVAEFRFHHAIMPVRVIHNLLRDLDILLERLVARVNHHARETLVNALFAQLERVAVVQMHRDGNRGQADRRLDQFFKVSRMGMLFTLNAPSAYLPFNAFAKSSFVCVNGIGFSILICRFNQLDFPDSGES
jgi:hypothetical protein